MGLDASSDRGRSAGRSARAYRSLRAAIIEAALPPDTRLGEELLATHYGVSRTLIRGVLGQLVDDGLVDTGKGKSARVAHPTREEAHDAFVVRVALEREVIRALADAPTTVAQGILTAHVDAEREALANLGKMSSARLGGEFHIVLARLSGNALLYRYVSAVVSRTALILSIYGREIDQATSIDEHAELTALIVQGDTSAALALAERHLGTVEERTLRTEPDAGPVDLTSILARYSDPSTPDA